jgi:3-deoxy-D-manno-octulosonate 8-phosphate phosphatase (KDO 8-P phosphatase)
VAAARTPLDRIRLLLLDVDGVMTDGSLYYGAGGEVFKVFHVHDGLGIVVMNAGVAVALGA